tara:strand:+ start:94 stop:744 length:651 start_codon:yes stop_codon:yes gene_type:complete
MPNLELEKKLDHNAKPIKVDNIITPLEVSTDKLWYQKTPTDTYEVVNKKYVDDNTGTPDTLQYYYDIRYTSYYTTSSSAIYLPMNGTTSVYTSTEKTSVSHSNEYVGWVAPYNGTIEKIFFRSEIAMPCDSGGTPFEIHTYYSADGTETPTTANMRFIKDDEDVADDTTIECDFTGSLYSGDNTLVKGRIYAIKVTTPAAPYDTNVTAVFKWDVTT